MRPPRRILNRNQVHRLAAEHLHSAPEVQGLQAQDLGPGPLVSVAGRRRADHLAGRRLPALRDAPGDSAAHDALLATLPDSAELQRRINRALQGDLPRGLRRRRQPLACDLTLTPYHGRPLHDANEVYRSKAKGGTTHFHAYATAYVVRQGQRYTAALLWVKKGQALKDVLRELLRLAARAGVRPRYLLLDKGFCSVEIIRYLQRADHSLLMPVVCHGRKPDHPKGPSGTYVFRTWPSGAAGPPTRWPTEKRTATVGRSA